ncbi:sulfotransferase family protein [Leisingera sp. McT4-56]|nr:sulfotransferase family protein [Leisingera sp. McT4-56]
MRNFDPGQPLIFIHIPKTAGVSVRTVFQNWFRDRLKLHYYDEGRGQLPAKIDLQDPAFRTEPPVIYGHFNRLRQFGVPDYYPEARQFVSFLRDPFDMHVSRYFFTQKSAQNWKRTSDVEGKGLHEHLESGHLNMLEHFPRPVTSSNFRGIIEEFFVDIGCFETLEASLKRIAARLGLPAQDIQLPHLNASKEAETPMEEARARFRERWPLEYEVYDYVRSLAPQR